MKNRNLKQLIRFYQCANKQEFFNEMRNCLQLSFEIKDNNYKELLSDFEKEYDRWVGSFK